jgi:hypothetical protein
MAAENADFAESNPDFDNPEAPEQSPRRTDPTI